MSSLFRLLLILPFCFFSFASNCQAYFGFDSLKSRVCRLEYYFAPHEIDSTKLDFIGVSGTAWFYLDAHHIVTARHVTDRMRFCHDEWRSLQVSAFEVTSDSALTVYYVQARVIVADTGAHDGYVVLELDRDIPGASGLLVRNFPTDSLIPFETASTLSFPNGVPRFAKGRYIRHELDFMRLRCPTFELFDRTDRFAVDSGSSGAPIVDECGQVVAVTGLIAVNILTIFGDELRVSTAWGEANVFGLPVSRL